MDQLTLFIPYTKLRRYSRILGLFPMPFSRLGTYQKILGTFFYV